jgi:hypothetical protein
MCRLALLALMVFLGALAWVRPAAADEPPRTAAAVLPARLTESLEAARPAVEKAVAEGVGLAGADAKAADKVREAAATRADLLPCASADCAAEIGRLLGAVFLVATEVESGKRSFTVRVRVVRAADGHDLALEAVTCQSTEPCAPVPDTARDVAREATRKALGQAQVDRLLAERQRQAAAAALAARPSGAPATAPAAPIAPPSPADGATARARRWPWAVLAGGVALIAAGTLLLLVIDDSETDCEFLSPTDRVCHKVRDAALEGTALLGLGVAAAAGAGLALVLTRDDHRRTPAVTVAPRAWLLRPPAANARVATAASGDAGFSLGLGGSF